jgi:hypothetical protein
MLTPVLRGLPLFVICGLLFAAGAVFGQTLHQPALLNPGPALFEGPPESTAAPGFAAPPPAPAADAYGHLQILSSWEHRRAGTPEYAEAAAYVLNCFQSWGYAAGYHDFSFPYYRLFRYAVSAEGQDYECFPVFYSGVTDGSGVTGLVVGPDGDLNGNIVLAGADDFSSVYSRAVRQGARAVLRSTEREPFYSQDLVYGTRMGMSNWRLNPIPALVCANTHLLHGRTVNVVNSAELQVGRGRNIVAVKPGFDNRWIIVSAHLDTWFNGAVDDGTGVAMLLELAERLKRRNPRYGLLFLVCDAEEIGLLGSAEFCRIFPPEQVYAFLELDMVSTTVPGMSGLNMPPFLVYSANLLPQVVNWTRHYPGTEILFPALLADWIFGVRTDYQWYWGAGVPGLFVNVLPMHYHTPEDTIDKVDAADLAAVTEAGEVFLEDVQASSHLGRSVHLPTTFTAAKAYGQIALRAVLGWSGRTEPSIVVQVYHRGGYLRTVRLRDNVPGQYDGDFTPPGPGRYDFLLSVEGSGLTGLRWASVDY